jgi:hypothetical protein
VNSNDCFHYSKNVLFVLLVVLGFGLRASCLLGRHSTSICSGYFTGGSYFLPRLSWISVLLFYTPYHSWDDRCMLPHPVFSFEMGSSKLILPKLAWNCDLPDFSLLCNLGWQARATELILISASLVARITGVSLEHLVKMVFDAVEVCIASCKACISMACK